MMKTQCLELSKVLSTSKFKKIDLTLNVLAATAAAKSLQLCPTLSDRIDGSP